MTAPIDHPRLGDIIDIEAEAEIVNHMYTAPQADRPCGTWAPATAGPPPGYVCPEAGVFAELVWANGPAATTGTVISPDAGTWFTYGMGHEETLTTRGLFVVRATTDTRYVNLVVYGELPGASTVSCYNRSGPYPPPYPALSTPAGSCYLSMLNDTGSLSVEHFSAVSSSAYHDASNHHMAGDVTAESSSSGALRDVALAAASTAEPHGRVVVAALVPGTGFGPAVRKGDVVDAGGGVAGTIAAAVGANDRCADELASQMLLVNRLPDGGFGWAGGQPMDGETSFNLTLQSQVRTQEKASAIQADQSYSRPYVVLVAWDGPNIDCGSHHALALASSNLQVVHYMPSSRRGSPGPQVARAYISNACRGCSSPLTSVAEPLSLAPLFEPGRNVVEDLVDQQLSTGVGQQPSVYWRLVGGGHEAQGENVFTGNQQHMPITSMLAMTVEGGAAGKSVSVSFSETLAGNTPTRVVNDARSSAIGALVLSGQ